MKEEKYNCEAEGCKETADVLCHIVYYESPKELGEDIYYWYCIKHAKEHGFCYICGEFFAGCEEFDFPEAYGCIPGLCPNCSEQVKVDCGEYDEEDETAYYDFEANP